MDDKKQTKAVEIIGGEENEISDNLIHDFDVGISAKDTKRLKANGNIISKENQAESDPGDKWYKKPIGIVTLAVAGTLLAWGTKVAISHFLGIPSQ